jgi:hypothetical protein
MDGAGVGVRSRRRGQRPQPSPDLVTPLRSSLSCPTHTAPLLTRTQRPRARTHQGVIVTGGGTGLGFAIAKELVGLGAQVLIAGASLLTRGADGFVIMFNAQILTRTCTHPPTPPKKMCALNSTEPGAAGEGSRGAERGWEGREGVCWLVRFRSLVSYDSSAVLQCESMPDH